MKTFIKRLDEKLGSFVQNFASDFLDSHTRLEKVFMWVGELTGGGDAKKELAEWRTIG